MIAVQLACGHTVYRNPPGLRVPLPRKTGCALPRVRLFTKRVRLAEERRAFGTLTLEKCIWIREHQRLL